MKREELDWYRGSCECLPDDVYDKEEADQVMDTMERRIARLTKCVEMWKKVNEDLQFNNTRLRKRIKDFESNHKLWEAENDALKQRVKELEEQLLERAKRECVLCKKKIRELEDKNNADYIQYQRKTQEQAKRIAELEQALAMASDPALHPTCTDCDKCVKEK